MFSSLFAAAFLSLNSDWMVDVMFTHSEIKPIAPINAVEKIYLKSEWHFIDLKKNTAPLS